MFEDTAYPYLFQNFERICAIPHGSGNEKALSDYLLSFAREHGAEAYQDDAYNVYVRLKASDGREREPGLILQGHMDMVCEKNSDTIHDFLKDPISLIREGDFLHAAGTTLGGDDGIAIAYMMSLIEHPELPHPPLELVMTVSEETGMYGAAAFDLSCLQASTMINLDSEEEGIFIAGGAGGMKLELTGSYSMQPVISDAAVFTARVSGLIGGHSGEDINCGRANAIKLLAKLLERLQSTGELRLFAFEGGTKDNAIPREAFAVFAYTGSVQETEETAAVFEKEIREAFDQTDPGICISLKREPSAEKCEKAFSPEASQSILAFLNACPSGMLTMSRYLNGMVETSQNLASVRAEEELVRVRISLRSNVDELRPAMEEALISLARACGLQAKGDSAYPAWNYRAESPIREKLIRIYRQLTGKEPKILSLHAGLECGLFASVRPDLDMISMGPDMTAIHSPQEKLSISSTERTWAFLLEILSE